MPKPLNGLYLSGGWFQKPENPHRFRISVQDPAFPKAKARLFLLNLVIVMHWEWWENDNLNHVTQFQRSKNRIPTNQY